MIKKEEKCFYYTVCKSMSYTNCRKCYSFVRLNKNNIKTAWSTPIERLRLIKGRKINWRKEIKKSRRKRSREAYCEVYDVMYNIKDGEWKEKKCDNQNCEYCSKRPRKHPKDCRCLE